jgi:hypothetical protein
MSACTPEVSSKDYVTMTKRAIALAKLDRLAGGNKSVFDANMDDIGALGIGMQLYFMLTKYLSITFLLMGIVSLPSIVVNMYGNGVSESMADPLALAYASLGNQGVNPDTKTDQNACLPKGDIDCNWTTVNTPFTTDPVTVAWIITVSDVSYSLVFLGFFLLYRFNARKAIDTHMNENLTPAKFAIFVRGLPSDATEAEILDHFNKLYDLTKDETYHPLWLGCCWGPRRKVKKSASASRHAANRTTVQNLDHLAVTTSVTKELYFNTWIAEVSIGHPTGGLLKTFLSMEALTRSIAETQELVNILEAEKKTAPATGKLAFKPSDEKLLQATNKKLQDLNSKLEKKTSKIKALKHDKTAAPLTHEANEAMRKVKKVSTIEHAFNWDACECAFVIFNNVESRRRCLYDYRGSTRKWARRFQPKDLRFRKGKYALIVRPAPEPSNILWENLEVTDRGRFYRRSLTNFVTFLLLLLSCGIISGAQSAQAEMKKKMVSSGFCDLTLPLVFYGNDSLYENTRIEWHLSWNASMNCAPTDAGQPRYHIAYDNGIINTNLNITRPAKTFATSTRCVDTCVSETSNRTCSTLPCFDQELLEQGEMCETYPETNILYCLCKDAVAESIQSYGFLDGPKKLWQEMIPCRSFISGYVTRNVLMYLAAGIVVIVNLLLKAILRGFATFEAHSSESAKASAIAIKMFSAQFLNTAVIVLIVNAALSLKGFPLLGQLFQGKYKDFERDWYPTVGIGITMTMLINAFVPQIVLFVQMFIVGPLTRCFKHRKLRTQAQMNKLYAGPEFDISIRYPMVLNSLFVTMVFCGGMPVLLFIASLTVFGTYWFDKLSIIHLYSVKTAYDEEMGETALAVLPWTLALHLSISTWMYGNQDLMKATTIDLKVILDILNIEVKEANGTAVSPTALYDQLYAQASKFDILGENGFVVKVVRKNAMVMFLFFAVVVVGLLLSTVISQILWPILKRTLVVLIVAFWRKLKQRFQAWRDRRRARKGMATAKVHVDNAPLLPATAGEANTLPAVPTTSTPRDAASNAKLWFSTSVAPLLAPAPPQKQPSVVDMMVAAWTPRKQEVAIPEFTDYFRKTISKRFTPDKQLGFQRNDKGELIRVWLDETVHHGIRRAPGEPMRTWEAMQAPVKSYAIEANDKYRLAVAELVAAHKRLKAAATTSSAVVTPAPVNEQQLDAAIAATEPMLVVAMASPRPISQEYEALEPAYDSLIQDPSLVFGTAIAAPEQPVVEPLSVSTEANPIARDGVDSGSARPDSESLVQVSIQAE